MIQFQGLSYELQLLLADGVLHEKCIFGVSAWFPIIVVDRVLLFFCFFVGSVKQIEEGLLISQTSMGLLTLVS